MELGFGNAPAACFGAIFIVDVGEPGEDRNDDDVSGDVAEVGRESNGSDGGEEEEEADLDAEPQGEFAAGKFFCMHGVHGAGAAFPIVTDPEANEITGARKTIAFDEITDVKEEAAAIVLEEAVSFLGVPFDDSSGAIGCGHAIRVSAEEEKY